MINSYKKATNKSKMAPNQLYPALYLERTLNINFRPEIIEVVISKFSKQEELAYSVYVIIIYISYWLIIWKLWNANSLLKEEMRKLNV